MNSGRFVNSASSGNVGGISAGNHLVQVRDANGCIASRDLNVPIVDVTPPEIKRASPTPSSVKTSIHDLTKKDNTIQPEKKETPSEKPKPALASNSKKHQPRIPRRKQSNNGKGKNGKYTAPSVPSAPVLPKDDEEEGWAKLTGQDIAGRKAVKSR